MEADPDTGGAVLDADAFWTLLQCAEVGRLAVSIAGGDPDIFPVNYVIQYGTIVFRTASGSTFRGGLGRVSSMTVSVRTRARSDNGFNPPQPSPDDLGRTSAHGCSSSVAARSTPWNRMTPLDLALVKPRFSIAREKAFWVPVSPTPWVRHQDCHAW